jgi:hypothetical protein
MINTREAAEIGEVAYRLLLRRNLHRSNSWFNLAAVSQNTLYNTPEPIQKLLNRSTEEWHRAPLSDKSVSANRLKIRGKKCKLRPGETILEIPIREQEQMLRELRAARYGHLLAIHVLLLCARGKTPTEIAEFLFCSR